MHGYSLKPQPPREFPGEVPGLFKEKPIKRKRPRKAWSEDENTRLRNAVKEIGVGHWTQIAKKLPDRTPEQISQHWMLVMNPGNRKKGMWFKSEDQLLLQVRDGKPGLTWAGVAAQIQGRTPKQCRERWNNTVDPSLKRTAWTQEEDGVLLKAWQQEGTRWNIIAKLLPGRTQIKVRDRFKALRCKAKQEDGIMSVLCKDTAKDRKRMKLDYGRKPKPASKTDAMGAMRQRSADSGGMPVSYTHSFSALSEAAAVESSNSAGMEAVGALTNMSSFKHLGLLVSAVNDAVAKEQGDQGKFTYIRNEVGPRISLGVQHQYL